MPIPDLTEFGVLPAGCHDCTVDDIAQRYVANPHRETLWARFQQFREWLNGHPKPSRCLIDGSFTSDKAEPKDIDVVFDLSDCDEQARNHWFFVFMTQREQIMDEFRVDFWVFYPGAGNDLRAFFEYIRPEEALARGMLPEDRKGLLRIEP